jgi:hypothetical protein
MKSWVSVCLTVGLLGLASASCSDKNNPIVQANQALDCNSICDRYKDCFDKNYDTDKCQSDCDSRADEPDHKGQEEKCSNCISKASCTGAVFSCTPDCAGIVP